MGKIISDITAEAKATELKVKATLAAHMLIVIAISLFVGIVIGASIG
jgi:hypothetical protein